MIEIKYEAENVLSALERLQLAAVNTSPIMAQIAGVMHDAVEEFQSSPAPKDGRYRQDARGVDTFYGFQSSPAPKDGRYMFQFVSDNDL